MTRSKLFIVQYLFKYFSNLVSEEEEGGSFESNFCHFQLTQPIILNKACTPVQCTAYYFDYLMVDFKHSQIRQQRAEIVSIDLICLIVHCPVNLCADLRIEFLRLSSIKKCPHMLRSDQKGVK